MSVLVEAFQTSTSVVRLLLKRAIKDGLVATHETKGRRLYTRTDAADIVSRLVLRQPERFDDSNDMVGVHVPNNERADDRLGVVAHGLSPIFRRARATPAGSVGFKVLRRRFLKRQTQRKVRFSRYARLSACVRWIDASETKAVLFECSFAGLGQRNERVGAET
nr:hypothetical protein [Caballeronia sp. AZ10_KS36]